MVIWNLVYTKQAKKDAKKIAATNLKSKVAELLAIIQVNPFQNPPAFRKVVGDLVGAYSRRINVQHRLIYEVVESEKTLKIIRMWTHCQQPRTEVTGLRA